MQIISCRAKNFASYKELNFNFQDQGLTLVHGATGSGKSTLCDIIPWALFGRTAKDGAADEVLSWNSDAPTEVTLGVEIGRSRFRITRRRGPKSKDNDLYLELPGSEALTRGKDIIDTQRRINELLGITPELYLAGAYFHEFSQTAGFFTATAKNRRTICEQLVDLSLPKKIWTRILDEKPYISVEAKQLATSIATSKGKIELLTVMMNKSEGQIALWEAQKKQRMESLEYNSSMFEEEKRVAVAGLVSRIDKLKKSLHSSELLNTLESTISELEGSPEAKCNHCGAEGLAMQHAKELRHELSLKLEQNKSIDKQTIMLSKQVEAAVNEPNNYANDLEALRLTENPHFQTYTSNKSQLRSLEDDLIAAEHKYQHLSQRLSDFDLLSEAIASLRANLIKDAIHNINDSTNQHLSRTFDAEIKVDFTVEDADKLDVVIYKDGHQCAYTQLSKGQRGMLKLCFGVAVMKQVANYSGVSFNQIFFDEALDGLDENLKIKAYQLLQELSLTYNSVFIVEHSSAFKEMFPKKLEVQLVEGMSQIAEA